MLLYLLVLDSNNFFKDICHYNLTKRNLLNYKKYYFHEKNLSFWFFSQKVSLFFWLLYFIIS